MFAVTPAAMSEKRVTNEIDFGAMTCKGFLTLAETSSQEDVGAIMLWLDGYSSGVSGDKVLNWKNYEAFATNLETFCTTNGRVRIIDAAKKVGTK